MVMIEIYARCGRWDDALNEMEELLSLEIEYTVNDFKLNPLYNPIKDNPRFQELMKKYALASDPFSSR